MGEDWPHSEDAAKRRIKRDGWDGLGPHMARLRAATGGWPGMEYHVSLLPEALQAAISGTAFRGVALAAQEQDAEADRRRMAALRIAALASGPRAVMEARAEVLLAIEGYGAAKGLSRPASIRAFLAAQDAWLCRQEIEAARDAGQFLTDDQALALTSPLELTWERGFHLKPEALAQANDRAGEARIGRTALYDWFKARDGGGVLALAPKPTRVDAPIPDAFFDFMRFYAVPSKPSLADAHREYLRASAGREGVQPMTLTLEQARRILKHKLNHIEKNVGREGVLTLKARLPYVTRTTDDMWPTTIYTADGKTFDAEVADPVSQKPMRPEITSVLDVATRKCVGYAVSRKENVIAVTEALRRSCSAHGICAIFYTDRGAGYKNKAFDADVGGLMARLGITKMHALPYNSQAKGIVERFNHVWNDVAKRFPSYMGRDMDKEARQTFHKVTRLEIKTFGQSSKLPTWAEFIAAVEAGISAYNDRPHSGLPKFEDPATGKRRHMTPNEAWDMTIPFWTATGTIDLAALRPMDLNAFAIGDTLAKINRFGGRTPEPWSVAAHSVLVERLCPPDLGPWALLHNAHDAIIGDITPPAVEVLCRAGTRSAVEHAIRNAKGQIDRAIGSTWGAPVRSLNHALRMADHMALLAEALVLLGVRPEVASPAQADALDRAVSCLMELVGLRDWHAARTLWLGRVGHYASLGYLSPPRATPATGAVPVAQP